MANFTARTAVIGAPTAGVFPVTIGSNTEYFTLAEVRDMWNGRIFDRIMLLHRIAVILDSSGLDPNTMTRAQANAALALNPIPVPY
jgi:hypothetical protein